MFCQPFRPVFSHRGRYNPVMRVIYADSVLAVNMAVNYILLLFAARISAAEISRVRLAAGALLGAAYALMVQLYPAGVLTTAAFKLTVAVLMLLAAFGGQRAFGRKLLLFLGASAALAGSTMLVSGLQGGASGRLLAFAPDLRVLLPSFAGCYALFSVVLRGRAAKGPQELVSAEICHNGARVKLTTLLDTGCSLVDPVSNRPVLVVHAPALEGLLPESVLRAVAECADAASLVERLEREGCGLRFFLLPYSAVGVEHGLLAAFRPDEVIVDRKLKKGMLVALSRTELSNGAYRALTGV